MAKMMQLLFVMNSGERRICVVESTKDKLADDFADFSRSFFRNNPELMFEFKVLECENLECGASYPHNIEKCFTYIALRVGKVEMVEAIKHVEIDMKERNSASLQMRRLIGRVRKKCKKLKVK